MFGKTSAMGVSGVQGQYNFLDSTGAFTRNGSVLFDRPGDMVECEVGGQSNLWIRAYNLIRFRLVGPSPHQRATLLRLAATQRRGSRLLAQPRSYAQCGRVPRLGIFRKRLK